MFNLKNNITSSLINILEVTGHDCGGEPVLKVIKFVMILLDVVMFIVPIALIVMLVLDFAKNILAGREDDMKKNLNIAIKRVIFVVFLFLVPTIVDFSMVLLGDLGIDYANCVTIATTKDLSQFKIEYNEEYDPPSSNLKGDGSGLEISPDQDKKDVTAEDFLNVLKEMSDQVEKDYKSGKKWTYLWKPGKGKYQATFEVARNTNRNATCVCLPSWGLIELGLLEPGDTLNERDINKNKGPDKVMYTNQFDSSKSSETKKRTLAALTFIDGEFKTPKTLEKEGILKPGDIIYWGKGLYHLNVYAGDKKWYDAGRGNPENINLLTFTTWGPVEISGYYNNRKVFKIARIKES